MKKILLITLCISSLYAEVKEDKTLLYYSDVSSSSKRVKLAMDYKGIPYQLVTTDPTEQSDAYRKINPMKKVPALYIDGRFLSQSVAILEYLEETRPERPLLPSTPYERAIVRQLVQIIACDIQPLQNGAVLQYVNNGKGWARFWIERGFKGVEAFLSQHAGKYSIGNSLTMADLFLYPQLQNAEKYGVDLKQYEQLNRVKEELKDYFEK